MPKMHMPLDMQKYELRNPKAHVLASAPSAPAGGIFYYNSTDGKLYWYDAVNAQWQSATGGAIDFGEVGDISASAPGDTAAAGSSGEVADAGHRHAREAHGAGQHTEMLATADLTDWPRTAALDLNNQKITSLLDGTATTDAATYGQVLALLEGKKWKDPVRAATTAAGTLASSFENGDTIDGVALATGDRILVKNQASGSENGIYTVNASGAPTRAADASAFAELNGATVLVNNGTVNKGDTFTQTAVLTGLGDTQTWAQSGEGNSVYTAGAGITLTGTAFAADTAVVVRKYATSIGDNATTLFTVTHNLGSRDATVAVVENGDDYENISSGVDIKHPTVNTVTVEFGAAPTTDQYRVVVHV